MRRPRGFMMVELIFAMGLLTLVAVIWASSAARVNRAEIDLANTRDAGYIAERAMLALRAGSELPKPEGNVTITVEPRDGGAAVPGESWVYVEATVGRQKQGLVGLVPAGAVKRGDR